MHTLYNLGKNSTLHFSYSQERHDVTHDRCYSNYINTIPVGDTARLPALCCNGEQSNHDVIT